MRRVTDAGGDVYCLSVRRFRRRVCGFRRDPCSNDNGGDDSPVKLLTGNRPADNVVWSKPKTAYSRDAFGSARNRRDHAENGTAECMAANSLSDAERTDVFPGAMGGGRLDEIE